MRRCFTVALLAALLVAGAASGRSTPPSSPPGPAPAPSPGLPVLGVGEAPARTDLTLRPSVVLDLRAGRDDAPNLVTLEPTFTEPALDGADDPVRGHRRFEAHLLDEPSGTRVDLSVEIDDHGRARLDTRVQYTRDTWVSLAALDVALPGPAEVLDNDLTPRPVGAVAYLDRFASKKLRVGPLTAVIDDGVDGVVARRITTATGTGTALRVELYSVEARPFRHSTRCAPDWRTRNPRLPVTTRLRRAGEHDDASVLFIGGDALVLAKLRYPEGRRAALLVTDHADQTAPETFNALARGRSDVVRPVGGLLGHHIPITKSLFLRGEFDGEGRRQLEDLRVTALAEEMAENGSEIIPHSVTPNPDDRATTSAGLDRFDRYGARSWIDHQPETNCEAFTNQGWRGSDDTVAPDYRIADLLAQHRYRYMWSALDQPELDLLGVGHLDRRGLTLWPLGRLSVDDTAGPGDPDERWMFKSVWMLIDNRAFFRALAPDRLDKLERERGVSILHTYLEALHAASDPRFGSRNILRRNAAGAVETDPRFEAVLDDLQRRVEAGTLWVPTLAALGDHLRAIDGTRVRYQPDGTALVESKVAIHALTLHVPGVPRPKDGSTSVLVDGRPPAGERTDDGGVTFWFDLPAATPVRVEIVSQHHTRVSFLAPPATTTAAR